MPRAIWEAAGRFRFWSGGRHDCFDAWRLWGFAETMPDYREFADVDYQLQLLAYDGQIQKFDGVIASHLYFFLDQSQANKSPGDASFH